MVPAQSILSVRQRKQLISSAASKIFSMRDFVKHKTAKSFWVNVTLKLLKIQILLQRSLAAGLKLLYLGLLSN